MCSFLGVRPLDDMEGGSVVEGVGDSATTEGVTVLD